MKKFTSALLAAAAVVTSAYADGAVSSESRTGAYVGGNVGMANTNVKYNYTNAGQNVTASGGNSIADRTQNTNLDGGKVNPLFGMFAGYGMQVGNMYFGGEVYGGFDSAKVNPYNDNATGGAGGYWSTTVKRTNFYGLAPRVGFFVTPSTMLYAKFGIEGGKWRAQIDPNTKTIDKGALSLTLTQALKDQSKVSSKASKNSISFTPGFGIDMFVTKNLFLRAEYTYMFGPKITVKQDIRGYDNTVFAGDYVVHKFQITQQTFKVGVGYKF